MSPDPQQLPPGLPPLPPVPNGCDRWEYRGIGWRCQDERLKAFWEYGDMDWYVTDETVSGLQCYHYIEAIPAESPAPATETETPIASASLAKMKLSGYGGLIEWTVGRDLETRALAAEARLQEIEDWNEVTVETGFDKHMDAAMGLIRNRREKHELVDVIADGLRKLAATKTKLVEARVALESVSRCQSLCGICVEDVQQAITATQS